MEEIFVIIPPLDKEEPKPSYSSALQPQHLTRKWDFFRKCRGSSEGQFTETAAHVVVEKLRRHKARYDLAITTCGKVCTIY